MSRVPQVTAFNKKCACGTAIRFEPPLTEAELSKEYKCPRCGELMSEGLIKLAEAINRYNVGAIYLNATLSVGSGYSSVELE